MHSWNRRLLLFLAFLTGIQAYASTVPPLVQNGFLDARLVDLEKQRLPLKGTWIWYDNQLLAPHEIKTTKGVLVTFPKIWNDVRSNHSGQGYATYTATIVLPSSIPALALDISDPYCSYRLWANGKVIAENGQVGTNKENTRPQWFSQAVSLPQLASDTLSLVLQVANFHHHKGGVKADLYLGEESLIFAKRSHAEISTLIEWAALLVMAFVFIALYFQQKRKKIILYFALFCFTWSVRALFSNDYLFLKQFPHFDWVLAVKVEYLTLYFTMIWCILFLSKLFIRESNPIIKYILIIVNGGFTLFTLLTSTSVFTQWLSVYLTVAGILLLYGVVIIVRATINERVGSTFLVLSILMGLIAFGYDFLTYQEVFSFNAFVLSSGYIITFVPMALALLLHLNVIKSKPKATNMLTYADLYKDDIYKVK